MTQPSTRGRRNPQLLADQQADALADGSQPDELEQQLDEHGQLLYDGETVNFTASIPVTLEGMDRYSLIGGESHCTVQPGEDPVHAAARSRLAVRLQILEGIDELEQDIAALAEQRAAERARMQQALS